ncbi:MAG: protein kinase [Isosphaeraceae bacterium]
MTERELFVAALRQPDDAARAAFLLGACPDPEVRKLVESMFLEHQRLGDFLEDPAAMTPGPAPAPEGPGVLVGPYRLLETIGEGGMGTVFLAEQTEPVRRMVALKVIKPGMDSKQVIARFEAERQALAMMDHPGIAKVHDAGMTAAGRPYFVMELVRGLPITEYCDRERLSIPDRLSLFTEVCRAVQHAHQKGIIHRDLKPTNVLVTMVDGLAVPKVIDFGVAKAIGGRLTDRTLFTDFLQLVGTPLYMSPEQADLSGVDVDTRSDIYSLGVLLYELLTGTTPFSPEMLRNAPLDELCRLVREWEPPRPSTRLSGSAAALTIISARRRTEPAGLSRLVRGDLDWIVMKALEKDRGRRYEAVTDLAADVQRYLQHEPVQASPPSSGYRLRKFVRRNKGPVLAAVALVTLLVLGIVGTSLGLARAHRAETTARRAEGVARLAAGPRPNSGSLAVAAYQEEVRQRRRARKAVDDMYTRLAEQWLADQPRMQQVQREFLEKALQYYEDFSLSRSQDEQERFEAANAYYRVAEIRHRLGRYADAEKSYRQAVSSFEALVADVRDRPEFRLGLLKSLSRLGASLYKSNQLREAESIHRRGVGVGRALAADSPETPAHWRWLAVATGELGMTLYRLGRLHEAETAYREALEIHRTKLARLPVGENGSADDRSRRENLANTQTGFGNTLVVARRPLEAEPVYRESVEGFEELAREDPRSTRYREQLSVARSGLANTLRLLGKVPEAVKLQRDALNVQETLVADFPDVPEYRRTLAGLYGNLGVFLNLTGDRAGVEAAYGKAVKVATELVSQTGNVPEFQHLLANCQCNLGNLHRANQRFPEAARAYGESLRIMKPLVDRSPEVQSYRELLSKSYMLLGHVAMRSGRKRDALPAYRECLKIDPMKLEARYSLALVLATDVEPEIRDPREALGLTNLLVQQDAANPDYWDVRAAAQYRLGDWKGSLATLKESAGRSKGDLTAEHLFIKAMNLCRLGDAAGAGKCYDEAAAWVKANRPGEERFEHLRAEAASLLNVDADPKPMGRDPGPGRKAGTAG